MRWLLIAVLASMAAAEVSSDLLDKRNMTEEEFNRNLDEKFPDIKQQVENAFATPPSDTSSLVYLHDKDHMSENVQRMLQLLRVWNHTALCELFCLFDTIKR